MAWFLLVGEGMSNDKAFDNSGFGRSLQGPQEVKTWRVNPAWEKAEYDVSFDGKCALPPLVSSPLEQPASKESNNV